MNKFKLFPLALAAFAFSACTSEDAVENNPNVEGVKSYVAVNINNVGVGGHVLTALLMRTEPRQRARSTQSASTSSHRMVLLTSWQKARTGWNLDLTR